MAKIVANNKEYTGISASVSFVNGVGETSDPYLLDWFREHGYEVVEDSEPEKEAEQGNDHEKSKPKPRKKDEEPAE